MELVTGTYAHTRSQSGGGGETKGAGGAEWGGLWMAQQPDSPIALE